MVELGDGIREAQEGMQRDLRAMFRGAIRASLEVFLEAEREALVGAEWYERAGGRRDRRNGAYVRQLLTRLGQIAVAVPRTRENGSPRGVVGRYQRRTAEIDALLTTAYVHGVSQRKAGELTEALVGERVSRSAVSRVAQRLDAQVDTLRRAPIAGDHPYLYLDATFVDARWARTVENVSALIAYAVGPDGHRHLLGVALGAEESDASWSELLEQLVERGLTGGQLVIADEHAGLAAAVRRWWPEVQRQRWAPQRLRKRLARDVGSLFQAASLAEARTQLRRVTERWSGHRTPRTAPSRAYSRL
jgi:transposase-like protein